MERWSKLGKGSYGSVYLSHDKLRVKKSMPIKSDDIIPSLIELNTIRRFKHPNLVEYKSFTINHSFLDITMEACKCDLTDYIKGYGTPSNKIAKLWTSNLVEVTSFLNNQGYYHLDIKPQNILIDRIHAHPENTILKLCDFGCGNYYTFDMIMEQGTIMCRPPENFLFKLSDSEKKKICKLINCQTETYGELSDSFSVGVIWLFLLTGRYLLYPLCDYDSNPYVRLKEFCVDSEKFINNFLDRYHKFSEKLSRGDKLLIYSLVNPRFDRRLTCEEILPNFKDTLTNPRLGISDNFYTKGMILPKDKICLQQFIKDRWEEIISHPILNTPKTLFLTLDLIFRLYIKNLPLTSYLLTSCINLASCFFENDIDISDGVYPGIIEYIQHLDGLIYVQNPFMCHVRSPADFVSVFEAYIKVEPYADLSRWYMRREPCDYPDDITDFLSGLDNVIISVWSHPGSTDKSYYEEQHTETK